MRGFIQEHYAQWERIAEATKVLLDIKESNLDRNDPKSLLYKGEEDGEDEN